MSKYKFTVRKKPSTLTSAEYKEAYKLEDAYAQSLTGFKKFYGLIWLSAILIALTYTFFTTLMSIFACIVVSVVILVECIVFILVLIITVTGFYKSVKDALAMTEYYKHHPTITPQWYVDSSSAKGHARRVAFLSLRVLMFLALAGLVAFLTPGNAYAQNAGCVIIVGFGLTACLYVCLLWFFVGKKSTNS